MDAGKIYIGLRELGTNKLITVYPEKVQRLTEEIEDKVKTWYYQKDCGAEERLRNYFVDALSETEIKNLEGNKKHS